MSGFGAVFGRKGDGGFSGPLLGACSGDGGFNAAMFLRAAREICRPARPDVGASAKSSPCVLTMAKNWRLMARWASIFAEMPLERPRWASIFADQQSWDPAGRVCCVVYLAAEPVYWQC